MQTPPAMSGQVVLINLHTTLIVSYDLSFYSLGITAFFLPFTFSSFSSSFTRIYLLNSANNKSIVKKGHTLAGAKASQCALGLNLYRGSLHKKKSVILYDWGYIFINNRRIRITKFNLIKLIETHKKKAMLNIKNWEDNDFKDFQVLVNGVFQAEGYVGGSFPLINKYYFLPKLQISQNASISSINFFCLLWLVLGKNLRWNISKTSTNNYHITLLTSAWDTILKSIPYFSYVYGYKHRGFLMLKDMRYLLKSGNLTNEATIAQILILGYNLVELTKNRISLDEKYLVVRNSIFYRSPKLNLEKLSVTLLNNYTENNRPLSMLFILGFVLGDGNFLIRIRDTGKGLWFIPVFRIYQKNVSLNRKLLDNIANFFKRLGIDSRIEAGKEGGRLLCLYIESKQAKTFYSLLSEHSKWFFWKKRQFSPINKYLLLSNIASRHWKTGQLALLWEIYSSNAFPLKRYNFYFYKNKLETYFKNRLLYFKSPKATSNIICSQGLAKEDLFYICISKDKSWLVTLPVALKFKPKQKYFYFKTYEGNKDKALRAAIEYRDNCLNNWLINNGFKVQ